MSTEAVQLPSGDRPLVIACAYPDGVLGGPWFQAYRRLKRTLRRRGLWAEVLLVPDIDVPPEVDLLVLPADTPGEDGARGEAPERVYVPVDEAQDAIDALVERLVAAGRLRPSLAPSRPLALHRGFQAVYERARLPD